MRHWHVFFIAVLLAAQTGCSGTHDSVVPPAAGGAALGRAATGIGPTAVLTTSDGGQIFDFDINQHGNDGVLAAYSSSEMSVQTFDTRTGTIGKTIARAGHGVQKGNDYIMDGIFAGDVALIDFEKAGIPGQTPAKDRYHVLQPASGGKFTGTWNPTLKLFHITQHAVNQDTSTSVVFGYQRVGSDPTKLVVSNVAQNTVSKIIALDQSRFFLADSPQLAQDTVHGQAVIATSPSAGAAGGPPPVIATIDLASGKETDFSGLDCPGFVRCGYANGIGYDSNTGIACTTTELDGGIEFYHVAQQTGMRETLPNNAGQTGAGSYVINDAKHQLFLVAQTFSSTGPPNTSSIQVYAEDGTFIESIDGLNFTDAGFLVIPIHIAINPSKRIGWVNGPRDDQLTQFSY